MQKNIFRKYDIRGEVGKDLHIDAVYAFGRALSAYILTCDSRNKTVVIGMDSRVHSPHIKQELMRALLESGLHVSDMGVCPTPTLYFAMHTTAAGFGVMITASHNEKEYNGFKICRGKELIDAAMIQELWQLYEAQAAVVAEERGMYSHVAYVDDYVTWIAQAFFELRNSDFKVVIDCGNGAATAVIPDLVDRMGWKQVIVLHKESDGTFPHRSPDPTKKDSLKILSAKVIETGAACGIAFDGDADRMVVVTNTGNVVPGDITLALFAQEILKSSPTLSMVFDVKCSQVLAKLLRQWNAQYYITPTGHVSVKKKMFEMNAALAGELSCHFMFKDRYFGFDDGIYAMMRILEWINHSTQPLQEVLDSFPKSYTTGEVRIPCDEQKKEKIIASVHTTFSQRSDVEISTLDGVLVQTAYGWGIVRSSNTEPVMSFSCEAMTPEGFTAIQNDFNEALKKAFNLE